MQLDETGLGEVWAVVSPVLDERQRRVVAGGLARACGRGGVTGIESAKGVGRRLLDGVAPEMVGLAERVILEVDGVRGLTDLRLRFHGHQLHVSASVAVDAELSVREGHETAHTVEHELLHAFDFPVVATIHVDPHGMDAAHQISAHHN